MREERETLEAELKKHDENLHTIDVQVDEIDAIIQTLSSRKICYQIIGKHHEQLKNERDKQLQAEREAFLKQQQPLSVSKLIVSLVYRLFQTLLRYSPFESTPEKPDEAEDSVYSRDSVK